MGHLHGDVIDYKYQNALRQAIVLSSFSFVKNRSCVTQICPSVRLSVCLSVCLCILCIYLSIYLSAIYLSIYLSKIYLSIYLSTYLPTDLPTYLPIYLSIYLSIIIYLSIYLSNDLSIYLSTYLPIHPSIHPSIRPSIHPSIFLSFHPAYLQLFLTHLVTTASPGSLTIQHNVSTPCPKLSSSVPTSPRSFPFNKKAPQRRECTRTFGWWTERVMNNVGLILTIQKIDFC